MKTQRFKFIAIEGIDGVGKTTCAKLLANKMNAYYYKTPSEIFEKIRAEIEAIKDTRLRFIFYFTAVVYASREINNLLQFQSVICDRYIYSTVAYHKALGVDMSYINFSQLPIILPDFCFYLYAEENICEMRMLNRGIHSSSDAMIEKNKTLQRRIHNEFLKLLVIQIDTSRLNPNGVCEKIFHQISSTTLTP